MHCTCVSPSLSPDLPWELEKDYFHNFLTVRVNLRIDTKQAILTSRFGNAETYKGFLGCLLRPKNFDIPQSHFWRSASHSWRFISCFGHWQGQSDDLHCRGTFKEFPDERYLQNLSSSEKHLHSVQAVFEKQEATLNNLLFNLLLKETLLDTCRGYQLKKHEILLLVLLVFYTSYGFWWCVNEKFRICGL